jgi:electron transfer flavoprotein beta subunit
MKIIVEKQVPDTWAKSNAEYRGSANWIARRSDAVIDEIDERALEVASSTRTPTMPRVIALSAGPSSVTEVPRKITGDGRIPPST